MGVICVLPARLHSTRIPRKPLQILAGRPLLEWTWRAACAVRGLDRVLVATDAPEVAHVAEGFGAEVLLTSSAHLSGTDRVEEAATRLGVPPTDVVVNFQADEPFADPLAIEAAVRAVGRGGGEPPIATLAAPLRRAEEWKSPGVVKIARAADGRALYFSRAPIPFAARDRADGAVPDGALRHVGVYVCRREALRRWSGLPTSALERREGLEQLRALEHGIGIHVEIGADTEPGIDLPGDLERAERVLNRVEFHQGVPAS